MTVTIPTATATAATAAALCSCTHAASSTRPGTSAQTVSAGKTAVASQDLAEAVRVAACTSPPRPRASARTAFVPIEAEAAQPRAAEVREGLHHTAETAWTFRRSMETHGVAAEQTQPSHRPPFQTPPKAAPRSTTRPKPSSAPTRQPNHPTILCGPTSTPPPKAASPGASQSTVARRTSSTTAHRGSAAPV